MALRCRVTKNRECGVVAASGNKRPSSVRKTSRSVEAGVVSHDSAADNDTVRYWPVVSPAASVRSNTHCTGDDTAATKERSVTGRS